MKRLAIIVLLTLVFSTVAFADHAKYATRTGNYVTGAIAEPQEHGTVGIQASTMYPKRWHLDLGPWASQYGRDYQHISGGPSDTYYAPPGRTHVSIGDSATSVVNDYSHRQDTSYVYDTTTTTTTPTYGETPLRAEQYDQPIRAPTTVQSAQPTTTQSITGGVSPAADTITSTATAQDVSDAASAAGSATVRALTDAEAAAFYQLAYYLGYQNALLLFHISVTHPYSMYEGSVSWFTPGWSVMDSYDYARGTYGGGQPGIYSKAFTGYGAPPSGGALGTGSGSPFYTAQYGGYQHT